MPSKILSIEIGPQLTRVAEIDHKTKNPKIYHIFSLATPPEMLNDGNVSDNSAFVRLLTNALRSHSISTRKVVFVMNSTRVANRIIQVPYVKEKRIADLLNANASDYFPVDMEQYQLVHETMGVIDEAGEKKLQLSVLAIPRELSESYRALAKACGLTLEGLDYIGNSIKKMMLREIPENIRITIKIEENSSILTVIENGTLRLQRTINYGASEAIDAAINSQLFGYAIDPIDAVRELSRRTCLFSSFDKRDPAAEEGEEIDREKLAVLRTDITDSFRPLIGSTARILHYYQAQNPEARIEKIYLVGLGSVISGLGRLMTNELGYKVVASQQYSDIPLSRNIQDEAVHVAEYFTAIGATLENVSLPMNARKPDEAQKDGEASAARTSGGLSWPFTIFVTGVCVILAAVLCVYASGTGSLLLQEQERLNHRVDELSYIEDVIAEYDAAKADGEWASQVEALTESDNDNLVTLIGELEAKMPSEINILTLSATQSGIVLNIEVGSKGAAADVISQLRTFETISVSSVSTIAVSTDDLGQETVSFSVTCNYKEQTQTESSTSESDEAQEETDDSANAKLTTSDDDYTDIEE